jgi:hypothetical protein
MLESPGLCGRLGGGEAVLLCQEDVAVFEGRNDGFGVGGRPRCRDDTVASCAVVGRAETTVPTDGTGPLLTSDHTLPMTALGPDCGIGDRPHPIHGGARVLRGESKLTTVDPHPGKVLMATR